jgi:hypothetical protein
MKNGKLKKEQGLHKPQLIGSPGIWWFLSIVLVALSVFAFLTPTITETPEPRPYTVTYDFDYSAPIPPNPVYQTSELVYGQPIFLNIINEITTSVTYSINNPNVRVDNGQLVLRVVVIGSAGWTRTLAQSEPMEFTGTTSATATVPVNFAQALAVAEENNVVTGTQSTLNVRVIAETYVNGELLQNGKGPGGLDERTTADIVFNLKPESALVMLPGRASASTPGSSMPGVAPGTAGASTETGSASSETGSASVETGGASIETGGASTETGYLSTETGYLSNESGYLSNDTAEANSSPGGASSTPGSAMSNSNSSGGGSGSGTPGQDPSIKQITQMVPTEVKVPNKISLGFIELPVETARTFLTALAGLCVALAIYNTLVMKSVKRRGTIALIIATHGKRIVPMVKFEASKVKDAVVVPDFDAIYAISLETEQLIMIRRDDDGAEFYVSDNGTYYKCYVAEETESVESEGPAGEPGDGSDVETTAAAVGAVAAPKAGLFSRNKGGKGGKGRTNASLAVIIVSIMGVSGVLASAFAASITTSNGNAGQGVTVSAGYTAGKVLYNGGWTDTTSSNTSTNVDVFGFELKKASDGSGTSTVTDANTQTYAQLMAGTAGANWTSCGVDSNVSAGFTICMATGGQQMAMSAVTGVNIVAYDKVL